MLDGKMDWNGGMDYGMDCGIHIDSNTQLYCVDFVAVKGHVHI